MFYLELTGFEVCNDTKCDKYNLGNVQKGWSKDQRLRKSPMQQSDRRRTAQIQLLCTDKTLRASEEPSRSSTPYDMTEEIKP